MANAKIPDSEAIAPPPPPPETVPEELLNKLHEANQRFTAARHHREEAMDEPSPESTGREAAMKEFRDAEKAVENVTDEIDRDLHPPK